MQRREFLAGFAGMAGSLGFSRGSAATAPCPPRAIRVAGGSALREPCLTVQPTEVPAWYQELSLREWTPLAGGPGMPEAWQSGDRLAEAVAPPPYFRDYGPKWLTAGWNGACVDNDHREIIIALNGGHAARQENDAYALDLGGESPGWRRIVDSTPAADSVTGRSYMSDPVVDYDAVPYETPLFVPGWLSDGPQPRIAYDDRRPDLSLVRRRPKSLHTCSHYHYSNGRVWFPIMNAWNQGSGLTSLVKLALNMDALRAYPALKTWKFGDLGPWEYLGVIHEQSSGGTDKYGFGVAALDPSSGRLWYVGQKSNTYWAVETVGKDAGRHLFFTDSPRQKDLSSSAGAIAHDLARADGTAGSLFVFLEQGTFRVWLFDIHLAGTGKAWKSVEVENAISLEWAENLKKIRPSYSGYPAAYGMVYHEPSKAFLAYNCDQMPDRGVLRKLSIPLNADGTYDPEGKWAWSEVRLGGAPPSENNPRAAGIGGGGGSYTRFNIFPSFAGTGEALLVHLSRYDRATWVCKLPNAPLH